MTSTSSGAPARCCKGSAGGGANSPRQILPLTAVDEHEGLGLDSWRGAVKPKLRATCTWTKKCRGGECVGQQC